MYDVLKQAGFDVYFPSQHVGDCIRPYVVIKNGGAVELVSVSSERPIYEVLCYVPLNMYSKLEPMMFEIKQILKKLYPMIQYAGNETPAIIDEKLKAHMISFDYVGIRKIEYR